MVQPVNLSQLPIYLFIHLFIYLSDLHHLNFYSECHKLFQIRPCYAGLFSGRRYFALTFDLSYLTEITLMSSFIIIVTLLILGCVLVTKQFSVSHKSQQILGGLCFCNKNMFLFFHINTGVCSSI